MTTPLQLGYRLPAEWENHAGTWLSWPHNLDSWPGNFDPIPEVWRDFTKILIEHEPVNILAGSQVATISATSLVGAFSNVNIYPITTNDAWIRDHGPMFLCHENLPPALVDWEYNAWGGKYPPYDDDNRVPSHITKATGRESFKSPMILEGGSVEPNGKGTLLVTSQCLLNPNRNPTLTKHDIERELKTFTSCSKILWLGDFGDGSIEGDDTDAHIDQLARFVNPSTILCAWQNDKSNPDYKLLHKLYNKLQMMTDQDGKPFDVVKLPMPDPLFYEGQQLPASYCNFYIANNCVVVPTFGVKQDEVAISIIKEHFPDREVTGQYAVDLIWGFGAFHCMTMNEVSPYSNPEE